MVVRVKQIYYQGIHAGMIDQDFEPYRNMNGNKWLENQVFVDLRKAEEHKKADYFGIFSVKFRNKLGKTGAIVKRMIEQNPGFEVYSFFDGVQNMWRHADKWHPDFSKVGDMILSKIGYKGATKRDIQMVYSNHWIATPEVYERYVDEMLIPAMEIMESDSEINELVNRDSGYRIGFKGEKIASKETCLKVFGKPYYTYHPFICERLFATWADWNNIKIKVI
jgi:hypothetical protein